jgi:uncharacterized protein YecT (DUF1311 family)
MHRILLCLLLGTGISAPAQPITYSQMSPEWKAFYERQKTLRDQATAALTVASAREKSGDCTHANTTLDINDCLATETAATQKNYEDYLNAMGALLRLKTPGPADPASTPDVAKEFDQAESQWSTYRESQCRASSDRYFGGSIAPSAFLSCKLDLTRRHLHELENLYNRFGVQ